MGVGRGWCGISEPPPDIDREVKTVLDILGVKDISTTTREQIILALGRLLSVKASREASVHEVTKEVRRALELALRSPLIKGVNEALVSVVYTNPPFRIEALNRVYRELLRKLLVETVESAKDLSPMWRRQLVNLTVENLYNIATASETSEYKKKIFGVFGKSEEGEI
ncbi:MAG: hypothetical protein QXV08_08560 [Desulfurococcus sp.]|uniref:hypothetical protein n=1 Tax=Desulfurococcus sp. TaxID=51678 RepID=UPI00316D43B0